MTIVFTSMYGCRNPIPSQQHLPKLLPGTILDPPRITEADVQPSQGLWHEDQGGRGRGRGGGRGGFGGGRGRGDQRMLADGAHRMLNHSIHSMGLATPEGYEQRQNGYGPPHQQPSRQYDSRQVCCRCMQALSRTI